MCLLWEPRAQAETDTAQTQSLTTRSVPFEVCRRRRQGLSRGGAQLWFRPAALRAAQVEMRSIFVLAWLVGARVETHLPGGLAASPSGKAPSRSRRPGPRRAHPGVGRSMSRAALTLPIERATPWDAEDASHPFELPGCSEERARARARANGRAPRRLAQARDIRDLSPAHPARLKRGAVMLPVHLRDPPQPRLAISGQRQHRGARREAALGSGQDRRCRAALAVCLALASSSTPGPDRPDDVESWMTPAAAAMADAAVLDRPPVETVEDLGAKRGCIVVTGRRGSRRPHDPGTPPGHFVAKVIGPSASGAGA